MICPEHNHSGPGRCKTCCSLIARRAYYTKRGVDIPDGLQVHWSPGTPCTVCGDPVMTAEEKHGRTTTHRKCGNPKGDLWRPGDPCKRCGLPISKTEKHSKFKAHKLCIEAQQEETKIRKSQAKYQYRKKQKAEAKPKRKEKKLMPKKFIGSTKAPEPIYAIRNDNGVSVRRLPSTYPSTLRNPDTGMMWEL